MGGGPSDSVQQQQQQISQEQVGLAQQQFGMSKQMFGTTFPGLKTAENFYKQISSGDPNAMMRAMAPGINQIKAQGAQATKQIEQNLPRGGAQQLALAEQQMGQSAQIGGTLSEAYAGSFPALASLASGGIGASINQVANAISAYGGASRTVGQLGQEQTEGKAATMGMVGALGGAAAEGVAACWIAARLYGEDSIVTATVRYWLNAHYVKTREGAVIMWAYRRFGRQMARSLWVCHRLKGVFDRAYIRALSELADWEINLIEIAMAARKIMAEVSKKDAVR